MASDLQTRDTVASLLNYDVPDDFGDEADPFREIDTNIDAAPKASSVKKRKAGPANKENDNDDLLGLDSEVKIVKKRRPVVRLDDERLLSEAGIPKLRALARSRSVPSKLRFKGRGHEYSDAAKLLGFYQLWLDNLYPRARFADGLAMVEKVGHGKRMQMMRKEWIDEGKPGYGKDDAAGYDEGAGTLAQGEKAGAIEAARRESHGESGANSTKDATNDSIFGDLGDDGADLFFADAKAIESKDDDPDEDELDALLAEQGGTHIDDRELGDRPGPSADDEDELEALLGKHESATARSRPDADTTDPGNENAACEMNKPNQSAQPHNTVDIVVQPDSTVNQVEEEEDELEALLAERDINAPNGTTP